ncbi:MAG: NUDIX domain-containing protein [Oscillochloris sp.]|nr:NUDIX domain-containing protein [Oscillochloris sp.]
MSQIYDGLREAGLTIAYNLIVKARALLRQAVRPTEMGVRALVRDGSAILLVRHRGGRTPWGLPGGGIGRYEPLDVAAVREVVEEAGCQAQVDHSLGLYHHFAGGMSNYIVVFICTAQSRLQPPVGDLEIVDAQFFSPHALPPATEPGSIRRIAEYLQGERGIYRRW